MLITLGTAHLTKSLKGLKVLKIFDIKNPLKYLTIQIS